MPLRGLACRVLLAVLLLFAQQQAAVHELQHVFDELAHKTEPSSPQRHACPTCVAFSGVHHAADGGAPAIPTLECRHAPAPDVAFLSARWAFTAPYLSRGPPLLQS